MTSIHGYRCLCLYHIHLHRQDQKAQRALGRDFMRAAESGEVHHSASCLRPLCTEYRMCYGLEGHDIKNQANAYDQGLRQWVSAGGGQFSVPCADALCSTF